MEFADWPLADKDQVLKYLQDSGYRSERYQIFYISTPKVACTTLKWWFAALEGKVQALRAVTDSAESDPDLIIHGHNFQRLAPEVTGLSKEVLEGVLTSDSYFKFALVRNPYKRVFSAWQSKLLLQESLQVGPYKESEFLHYPISDERDIAAAFESFLEHLVCNEAPTFWDLHWSPQIDLLRPDLINYSAVFKIEESNKLGIALSEWTNDAVTSPFAGRRRNESLIPYLPSFITARSAELISHLYAKDFETFGYDKTPPESKQTFTAPQLEVALNAIRFVRARHHRLGERNVRINELNQALSDRDLMLSDLSRQVAEHQELVGGLNTAIAERDGQLHRLNELVAERESLIANLVGAAEEREAQITLLNDRIAEADRRVASLDEVLNDRMALISDLEGAAIVNEQQIAALNKIVVEREHTIAELSQSLLEKSQGNHDLHRIILERDLQVADLDQASIALKLRLDGYEQKLAEERRQIEILSRSVAEGNTRIVESGLTSVERDSAIDYLHRRIYDLDEHIRHLNQVLAADYQAGMERAQLELNQVLASRSWRMTAPLRKLAAPFRADVKTLPYSWIIRVANIVRIRRKIALRREMRLLKNSLLFNENYYIATYPDVLSSGLNPALHYLTFGARERRNPSAEFQVEYYLAQNPDVLCAGMNPLLHYLTCGQQEGRLFEPPMTLVQEAIDIGDRLSSDRTHEDIELTEHLAAEKQEAAKLAALAEEIRVIEASGLFDKSYYLSRYQDISESMDLVRHYCEHGWRESRDPSDDFSSAFYLTAYNDIKEAGLNPLWHYVVAGANESRQPVAPVATQYESNIWFGRVRTDVKFIAFYRSPDWSALRGGQPAFKGHIQPVLPHQTTGYYNALDSDALSQQAKLATEHGVYGFCFEMAVSGFGGVGGQPVDILLQNPDVLIHFCVQVILMGDDNIAELATALSKVFADERYIRVEDAPVLLIDSTNCSQERQKTVELVRYHLNEIGLESVFVIGQLEEMPELPNEGSSADFYDAVMDHPYKSVKGEIGRFSPIVKNGVDVVPYNVVAANGRARAYADPAKTAHPSYNTVTLARDNSTDKASRSLVYSRFDINDYRCWLDAVIGASRTLHHEDRRFVFINAWNDWNQGLFVEPDKLTGFSRLNELSRSLLNQTSGLATPKVSVIVANYNHAAYLPRRLESIYRQTYTNLEVILLDDCSTDNSREVLDGFAAAHPDVTKKLYNERNSGGTFRQWAKGIKAATGELIWIAESDDYCDADFLEKLVRSFDDEAVLLAYAKSKFVDKYDVPMRDEFSMYLSDLPSAEKWLGNYVETAHNEVNNALGIKNTIPNASSVLFRRPVDMPLLEDATWLSMRVAGDWVFYLHILRGGKIAFRADTTNYFRRYQGSTAEVTYKKEIFYREVGLASRTVAKLYNVPTEILERCKKGYEDFYWKMVGKGQLEFEQWYDYESILSAQGSRSLAIMVSTMGFSPGGAEILPIRLANEFKRQGHSVLLLSAGMNGREEGVRRMLRNDVPLVESSSIADVETVIKEFGIEVLNSHQWHIQKYPISLPTVFSALDAHVASLHGMIEHGDAFQTTEAQLRAADDNVTTWVYTAEKNLGPFAEYGIYDHSDKFVKIPNGLQPPSVVPVPRAQMAIPDQAFVLCCVSRAIPDKGWTETIAAVARARELTGRDIRLILVGNGPVYDEYCRIGVPEFVYLAGFSENAVGYYASADLGIMLTKFKSESFPLTIVDCLFAGKPYVATDVGDIHNMLVAADGLAGEVIPLNNWEVPIELAAASIARFASDEKTYSNALALVGPVAARYKIDVVAKQYVDLFQRDRLRSLSGGDR